MAGARTLSSIMDGMTKLRILSQLGDADNLDLPPALAQRVEVIHVPPEQPIAPMLRGDVLDMRSCSMTWP